MVDWPEYWRQFYVGLESSTYVRIQLTEYINNVMWKEYINVSLRYLRNHHWLWEFSSNQLNSINKDDDYDFHREIRCQWIVHVVICGTE